MKAKLRYLITAFAGLLILAAAATAAYTYERTHGNENLAASEAYTTIPETSARPGVTEAPGQPAATEKGSENSVVTGEILDDIASISRAEAGLDTIPRLDFSRFRLNPRIEELLQGSLYTGDGMKNGIAEPLLITERFEQPVIEDIMIGTDISQVLSILGEPSLRNGDIIAYKTKQYYILIKGAEKVQMVNFAPMPGAYDNDILKSMIQSLCIENIYLTDYLENSQTASEFFDEYGFIHGGGNYALSQNGVKVDTMSGVIEIYNNFEGNLYSYDKESNLSLKYVNSDSVIEDMIWDFRSYAYENESFEKNGKPSPSGKYIAKYDWITSMHHYFTIRTSDYSKPDYTIYAVARDFEWINDDYIIYLGMFTNLPSVIRVTDGQTTIRLIDGVDEFDYDYGSSHDFSIKEIKEDAIVLRNGKSGSSEEEELLLIFYSIDEDGNFILEN